MWTFVFGFMGVCLAIGVLIGALFIPLLIYTIPYGVWLEDQKSLHKIPKKLESEDWMNNTNFEANAGPGIKNILRNTVNATKLYRSWITKKPHGITKF